MICAECGSRYKRVTWTAGGRKRIVWRCVNRLDHGKKYCKESPTVNEPALQAAIVRALNQFNEEDSSTYLALMKATIGDAIGLSGTTEEVELLQMKIEGLNRRMMELVNASVQSGNDIEGHEEEFKHISDSIEMLQSRINVIEERQSADTTMGDRLSQIQRIIAEREERKLEYDDSIVRQMIECIKVYPEGKLDIIFGGGYTVEENLVNES